MYKVAIIGAGPTGIAMVAELTTAGINSEDILLLEKTSNNNASVRQFYPAHKDINSVYKNIQTEIEGVVGFSGIISLDEYFQLTEKALNNSGVKVHFDTEVQKVIKKDDYFVLETSQGIFEAEKVVLASGVFSKPRRPDYAIPSTLNTKISFDILNLQKENVSDLDILVVGGGDSASEYVQTLAGMGNRLTLSYRQDNFFRMNQLNKDRLADLGDKVNIMFSSDITELVAEGDKIRVSFKNNEALSVDRIVYSLGGASPTAFMANCGIAYDENNVQLSENNETNVAGIFMGGDLSCGRKGGSLMLAFNSARKIMKGLNKLYSFPAPKSI